ncbi:lamin tail domain-containing protein [Nonomuraea sp. NPDC050663]|uniref:lamin tail domain-containing protein n=1 Tax=Nonomuraea sp. NPDC050663 TaxID=3364370 RepID=UPI0037A54C98
MRVILMSLVVAAGLLCVPAASSAAAAPTVIFTKVFYDSPGPDRRDNKTLNAEYAVIKNVSKEPLELTGWILRDKAGYKYRFADGTVLRAGASLRINSGQGTDKGTTRYWGRKWYVWNNDTDVASLRDAAGRTVAGCSWSVRPDGRSPWTDCKAKPKPTPTPTQDPGAAPLGSIDNPYSDVHPGAFCKPEGAYGKTAKGTLMRCTLKAGEDQPRWRAV